MLHVIKIWTSSGSLNPSRRQNPLSPFTASASPVKRHPLPPNFQFDRQCVGGQCMLNKQQTSPKIRSPRRSNLSRGYPKSDHIGNTGKLSRVAELACMVVKISMNVVREIGD